MPNISFEFFPPKGDDGQTKLITVADKLSAYSPQYVSVTYGAGGSTRQNTQDTVRSLIKQGYDVAPHLSFGQDDEETILKLLHHYHDIGVKRLVALRGDRPSGMAASNALVYANELVLFIRSHFENAFHIEVAAYPEIHPEAQSYSKDIYYLAKKFEAGADSAITQYFYNPESYFRFIEACYKQGIEQPIIPGIMPIGNVDSLLRFSEKCGADIPRWLQKRLHELKDDKQGLTSFSQELCTDLCQKLLDFGAPGLHFYTMNKASMCAAILRDLSLDTNAFEGKVAKLVS